MKKTFLIQKYFTIDDIAARRTGYLEYSLINSAGKNILLDADFIILGAETTAQCTGPEGMYFECAFAKEFSPLSTLLAGVSYLSDSFLTRGLSGVCETFSTELFYFINGFALPTQPGREIIRKSFAIPVEIKATDPLKLICLLTNYTLDILQLIPLQVKITVELYCEKKEA
jgi:hypothetical protein